MKLPLSWLSDYVKTDASIERICNALVGIGFEVEEVIRYGEGISDVVVGKITDIKAHPDADKLRICSVDVGTKVLTIITGAKNVNVGDVVPVALDGAVLPQKKITAAPLRGIMSYGMMCSGEELGIDEAFCDGASVDGILILSEDLPLGEDIVKALSLDEVVLDVSITANRPDCHSIIGLARELATALKVSFKQPSTEFTLFERTQRLPSVFVESSDCPIYTSGLIEDIKIEKSPKWMQRRLFMCGINPINNVVDITNYVLLEVGQPLHSFDLKCIDGGITVRNARKNEKITALNGEEYSLDESMTLICDDNKPLAIAGVMGGKYSGITEDTKCVFLESARFNRGSVRNTSLKLGLRSDSSAKFERGVDYFSVNFGRERALALFEILGVGKVTADNKPPERERKVVDTTIDDINGLLGIDVPKKSMIEILNLLGMEVETDCRNLSVSIPLYREDIDNFTDIAEEIIRFYGYDKLDETFIPTAKVTVGGLTPRQKRIEELKDFVCALGAYEIITYSFTDEKVFDKLLLSKSDYRRKAIRIRNPISEELSVMKTELVSGMLSTIATNLTRKNDNFRLFELAKVYIGDLPLNELPCENDNLCIGAVGSKEDFYSIKAMFTAVLDRFNIEYKVIQGSEPYLHPGMSADITSNGKKICSLGKLHPLAAKSFGIKKSDVFVGYLDLSALKPERVVRYVPLPKFPPVERDLAFVVSENAAVGEMIDAVKSVELVGEVELFDIYRGEQIDKGSKSVALKIKLVPKDKTLVDSEINAVMDKIVALIGQKFGAKVRE